MLETEKIFFIGNSGQLIVDIALDNSNLTHSFQDKHLTNVASENIVNFQNTSKNSLTWKNEAIKPCLSNGPVCGRKSKEKT